MALERLGPYRISRLLGRGGMGAVYEGVHEDTGERTAIKILSFAFADDVAFRTRFEAEIEMLKQLRHPNIVQLIGYGEQDGVLFYSMELVPGSNLHELLARGTRLTWREVADIAIQICGALKHAHDHGVIHRDLKPANLLRTREGVIKLTDFGIAKFFGSTQLTAVGGIIGTADYMSPEQAAGQGVTARSDLYSLGAVLYALLTGKAPFPGRNVTEILQAMNTSAPLPIRRLDPAVPAEFEEIVLQLLSRDPAKRIATPLALSKRLRAMLHGLASVSGSEDAASTAEQVTRVLDEESQRPVLPSDELQTQPATGATPAPVSEPTPPARAAAWDEQTVVTAPERGAARSASDAAGDRSAPTPTHYTEVGDTRRDRVATEAVDSAPHRSWQHLLSITGLALALAALAAAAWYLSRPPDADTLFARIQEATAGQPPDKLGPARDAIDAFLTRFPDDPRAAEVQTLQRNDEAYWLWRRLERLANKKGGAEYLAPLEREYVEAMRNVEPNPGRARVRFAEMLRGTDRDPADREILNSARHMHDRLRSSSTR